jgi:hypothetical protein
MDCVTDALVRRVNMIIYANYGEANARIIYGQDYDWDDVRTGEYNRQIEQRIQELVAASRVIIDEKEERQVVRIKALIRRYYHTKDESVKREFEDSNALYPFLFSRAWGELRQEREARQNQGRDAAGIPEARAWENLDLVEVEPEPEPEEILYPLDPELRDGVIEIERLIKDICDGLEELRARGAGDDILLQTCRKLVTRAREILSGKDASEVSARRLDSTRQSLLTNWKQIQSRLKAH